MDVPALHCLSLCTGMGGIELGFKLIYPSFRVITYVEREAYASANLVDKMEQGILDQAPIWTDVRTFDGRSYRGKVDIITAGYPCQLFSSAASGRNKQDTYVWPEVSRVISQVMPPCVFLENVTNSFRYLQVVRDALLRMGYCVLPAIAACAAEVGAPHERRRFFTYAYYESESACKLHEQASSTQTTESMANNSWWRDVPDHLRVADGISDRMERYWLTGNAIVPAVVPYVFGRFMKWL